MITNLKKAVWLVLLALVLASQCACTHNLVPQLSDTGQLVSTLNDIADFDPNNSVRLPSRASKEQLKAVWCYYNRLDSSQKEAYLELYDAFIAWINRDENDSEPFSYVIDKPGPTVNGYNIMVAVKADNPVIE